MGWWNRQGTGNGAGREGCNVFDTPSQKAIIYQSELDFISRCILDRTNIETGGELFGFWTQDGTPVVMYAVGPGPNARHHQTSFIQDSDYVANIEAEICNTTGIQHIGQWHSHHQLSLAHPSGGDVMSMRKGVGLPGFPRMLLCIGNCTATSTTVNAFNFHEKTPGQYVHAAWDVIPMPSPFRTAIDARFASRLYTPRTSRPSFGEMKVLPRRGAQPQPAYMQHWLTEDVGNVEIMKGFIRSAAALFEGSAPAAEILDSGEPLISLFSGEYRVLLPYGFPYAAPRYVIVVDEKCENDRRIAEDTEGVWDMIDAPLDRKFPEWLRLTLSAVVPLSMPCAESQPPASVQPHPDEPQQPSPIYDEQIPLQQQPSPVHDEPQQYGQDCPVEDDVYGTGAAQPATCRYDRLMEERNLLEIALPDNSFKFTREENGNMVIEGTVLPQGAAYAYSVRITRDAEYNLRNIECCQVIPEIGQGGISYDPLPVLIPAAGRLLAKKVTASTTGLDIYTMASLLLRLREKSMRDGTGIEETVCSLADSSALFDMCMRQERELLNIKID